MCLLRLFFVAVLVIPLVVTPATGGRLREGTAKEETKVSKRGVNWDVENHAVRPRRLVGPGDSPPNCESKCGNCTPCKPVQVPIKRDRVSTGPPDYKPVVWRCKCGDKLYIP